MRSVRRELRTGAAQPEAPPLDSLFSREAPTPGDCLVAWDPHGSWPGFSLPALAHGAGASLSEVVLLHESQPETPLALLRGTVLPTPEGTWLGVLQVEASPEDARALGLALDLLARAGTALVLAGSRRDKDLVRRIREGLRPDHWRGPVLQMLVPTEPPGRGEPLRQALWPRGLTVRVIEHPGSSADPDWTRLLLARLRATTDTPAPPRMTAFPVQTAPADSTASAAPIATPELPPLADEEPLHDDDPAGSLDFSRVERLLELAAMGPGVLAAALVDVGSAELLSLQALTERAADRAERAARRGCAMWQAGLTPDEPAQEAQTLQELLWSDAEHHHLLLPMPQRADLLLLVCIDRQFGDLSASRWQAAVARHQGC